MGFFDNPVAICLVITLLPLAAFLAMAAVGQYLPRKGDWVPTLAVGVAMALSFFLLFKYVVPGAGIATPSFETVYELITIATGKPGGLSVGVSVLVDNMTVVMLVVVTLVSFLVHVFSMGYLHGDVRYTRFFAFLGLFTFSMLGLVIAGNLLVLFMCWELVGVCSYFLIGHWYEKNYPDPKQITPRAASVKAFLTTRVGDLGFFLGIMMIVAHVGSLDFPTIFRSAMDEKFLAETWGTPGRLWLAAALLFIGPVGKSAQFPLHTWLPDAMEGPTPVSALIHAATMVAAGVYLVARMFPMFAGPGFLAADPFASPALLYVAVTGGVTAIFAATIAIVQNDIKKVLAYSTVSQLGFMMLGIGCGSVAYGMYHLFTHAMFKALLFLGSGSVIHGMHHEQDMRHMGGLRTKMPITFWTMLIGTLAIAGVPFFAGFISKDGILLQAFAYGLYGEHHGVHFLQILPWAFATVAAGLTAFYMFRMIFMTFTGAPRSHHAEEAHESPLVMTVPLMVLAAASVLCAGVFLVRGTEWFPNRINDTTTGLAVVHLLPAASGLTITTTGKAAHAFHELHAAGHYPIMGLSILISLIGIGTAWLIFAGPLKGRDLVTNAPFLPAYRRVLQKLYYVDWFYSTIVVGIVMVLRLVLRGIDMFIVDGIVNLVGWIGRGVAALSGAVDHAGVDGAVRGTGDLLLGAGGDLRRVQSGRIGDYVFGTVFSLAVIVIAAAIFGFGVGH